MSMIEVVADLAAQELDKQIQKLEDDDDDGVAEAYAAYCKVLEEMGTTPEEQAKRDWERWKKMMEGWYVRYNEDGELEHFYVPPEGSDDNDAVD